jgi:hypothetical protein
VALTDGVRGFDPGDAVAYDDEVLHMLDESSAFLWAWCEEMGLQVFAFGGMREAPTGFQSLAVLTELSFCQRAVSVCRWRLVSGGRA